MAQRLPFGEVSPGAKPLGAFVAPAQIQTAGAARPALLDSPSGIVQLQQGSGGSVQGYNQFEQVATALAPFSKALMNLTETGIVSYATGKIEEGYALELKNQAERAKQIYQRRQEQGATNAAATIAELEKVDPPGAALLQESNPWRAIGRRRFLAQSLAGNIDNALLGDLTRNKGELSGIQPGSPELAARKDRLTTEAMAPYGLDMDDPEFSYYVTPALNRAWDQYSAEQRRLWSAEFTRNTGNSAVAGVLGQAQLLMTKGATLADGTVVMPGDPRWGAAAGMALTAQIDQYLGLLGGADKDEAWKQLKANLGLLATNPLAAQAVNEIRLGSSNDPYEKRPRWLDSNPIELLNMQTSGLTAQNNNYQQGQQQLSNRLDQLWFSKEGPGAPGVEYQSADYKARVQAFRQTALANGYRDPDAYIKSKDSAAQGAATAQFGPTGDEELQISGWLESLGPNDVSPANIGRTLAEAKRLADLYPTDKGKKYEELVAQIRQKEKLFADDVPPGAISQINRELKQDLAPFDSKGQASFILPMPGQTMAGASGQLDVKLVRYANTLQGLMTAQLNREIADYRKAHPGAGKLPDSVVTQLVRQAADKVRQSSSYRQATDAMKPAPEPRKQAPGPGVVGVSKSKASEIPASTAKGYRVRAVMDGDWVYSELQALNKPNGRPSAQLEKLARTAGTTPYEYLRWQVLRYPGMDQDGSIGRWLQRQTVQQGQNRQLGATATGGGLGMLPTNYNAFSPGSWLLNMIAPPAVAATSVPNIQSRFTGPAGTGPKGALVTAARQLGIDPVALASVISLETGGTFNKDIKGGEGGRYRGLIQFGPTEQRTYGYRPGMSFEEQILGPVVAYLKARGVKPGHGVKEIYAAILTGNVSNIARGGLDWKDSFGTSVRGALPSLTSGGHYRNATRFLGI